MKSNKKLLITLSILTCTILMIIVFFIQTSPQPSFSTQSIGGGVDAYDCNQAYTDFDFNIHDCMGLKFFYKEFNGENWPNNRDWNQDIDPVYQFTQMGIKYIEGEEGLGKRVTSVDFYRNLNIFAWNNISYKGDVAGSEGHKPYFPKLVVINLSANSSLLRGSSSTVLTLNEFLEKLVGEYADYFQKLDLYNTGIRTENLDPQIVLSTSQAKPTFLFIDKRMHIELGGNDLTNGLGNFYRGPNFSILSFPYVSILSFADSNISHISWNSYLQAFSQARLVHTLASNRLSGKLPEELANYEVGQYIELRDNQFCGRIPASYKWIISNYYSNYNGKFSDNNLLNEKNDYIYDPDLWKWFEDAGYIENGKIKGQIPDACGDEAPSLGEGCTEDDRLPCKEGYCLDYIPSMCVPRNNDPSDEEITFCKQVGLCDKEPRCVIKQEQLGTCKLNICGDEFIDPGESCDGVGQAQCDDGYVCGSSNSKNPCKCNLVSTTLPPSIGGYCTYTLTPNPPILGQDTLIYIDGYIPGEGMKKLSCTLNNNPNKTSGITGKNIFPFRINVRDPITNVSCFVTNIETGEITICNQNNNSTIEEPM